MRFKLDYTTKMKNKNQCNLILQKNMTKTSQTLVSVTEKFSVINKSSQVTLAERIFTPLHGSISIIVNWDWDWDWAWA